MLKRGVPLFAVRQRMIIDKLDPDIIGKVNEPPNNYKKKSPKNVIEKVNKNMIHIKMPTIDEIKAAIINIKLKDIVALYYKN